MSTIYKWAAIALSAVVAFLSVSLGISNKRRDKAINDLTQSKLDKVIEVNENNQKVEDLKREMEKAAADTRNDSVESKRDELLKQSENYHGKGN